jgi:hypothetical protein
VEKAQKIVADGAPRTHMAGIAVNSTGPLTHFDPGVYASMAEISTSFNGMKLNYNMSDFTPNTNANVNLVKLLQAQLCNTALCEDINNCIMHF